MPAKRKTRSDRVGGALIRRINVSKAVTGLRDQNVAGAMQCARGTLAKRKRAPLTFTLGELLRLEAAFGWTAVLTVRWAGAFASSPPATGAPTWWRCKSA